MDTINYSQIRSETTRPSAYLVVVVVQSSDEVAIIRAITMIARANIIETQTHMKLGLPERKIFLFDPSDCVTPPPHYLVTGCLRGRFSAFSF